MHGSKYKQTKEIRMFLKNFKNRAIVFVFFAVLPITAVSVDEFREFQHFSNVEVTTPSQMRQSLKDTPGTITVISAKQIRQLGIRNIPDILRLVPGFHVDTSSPLSFVNRGSNEVTPRRLQVLIDGRSEVNPLVGTINWENLPVPIERIAFIEVVRSQSSAAYGPNAFFGAINIITKKNTDDTGNTVKVSSSSRGYTVYAKTGFQVGNTAVVVSAKQNYHESFDEWYNGDSLGDHLDIKKSNISSQTDINGNNLEFSLATVQGDYENPLTTTPFGMEIPHVDLDSVVASASYTMIFENHEIQVSGYYYDKEYDQQWEFCAPKLYFMPQLGELNRDNSKLVMAALLNQPLPAATNEELGRLNDIFTTISNDPTSFDTTCGLTIVNYRYRTNSLSIKDVWAVNDQLKISSSFNMAYRWIDSTTYGNGKTNLQKSNVFSSVEYIPTDWLTLNAGVMAESIGYELKDPQVSPRLGANIHFSDNQTLKFLWGKGKRLIDGIEVIDYNQVPTYFDNEIYGSTQQSVFIGYFQIYGNKNHVEEIESYEAVYYTSVSKTNLEFRYFEEKLDNILNYQDVEDYPITSLKRSGAEFSAQFNQIGNIDIRVAGHYINSKSGNGVPFEDYHAYGGSAYVTKYWGDFVTSLAYYGTSPVRYTSYDRVDFRVAKTFNFSDVSLDTSILLSHHRENYQRGMRFGSIDGAVRDKLNEVVFTVEASF